MLETSPEISWSPSTSPKIGAITEKMPPFSSNWIIMACMNYTGKNYLRRCSQSPGGGVVCCLRQLSSRVSNLFHRGVRWPRHVTGQSSDVSSPAIQQRPPALLEPPPTKYKCGDDEVEARKLGCVGINEGTIERLKSNDVSTIKVGYFKLVVNEFWYKSSCISQNQQKWEHGMDCIVASNSLNGSSSSGYTWECHQDSKGIYSFYRSECR